MRPGALERALSVLLLVACALPGRAALAFAGDKPVPDAAGAQPQHHQKHPSPTIRSQASYPIPDLLMIRDDGRPVSLRQELDDGDPVVLDFIYTTCTTVCSVSSQTFAQLQQLLGARRRSVHLASISIDPEQDTPEHLADYAKKFGAGPNWRHYTGSPQASLQAQQAFGVYRGDKMSHNPVTLVRAGPGRDWIRFDGFATAAQLLQELRSKGAGR